MALADPSRRIFKKDGIYALNTLRKTDTISKKL
jgi:hypothetical protein